MSSRQIISTAEMRQLDADTIASGVAGEQLMEEAGFGCFQEILSFLDKFSSQHQSAFLILSGPGNNGGDGHVIARYLAESEMPVFLHSTVPLKDLKGDALLNAERLPESVQLIDEETCKAFLNETVIVIIDALLGSGIKGQLREPYSDIVESVNHGQNLVIAIDAPSGLHENSEEFDLMIQADLTLCIGMPKDVLFKAKFANSIGSLRLVEISLKDELLNSTATDCHAVFAQDASSLIKRLDQNTYKTQMGKIALVGSCASYPGAIALSAKAAARSGAGYTNIFYPISNQMFYSSLPNAILHCPQSQSEDYLINEESIIKQLEAQDVVAIGPGLGLQESSLELVLSVLKLDTPVLIDADGLAALKMDQSIIQDRQAPTVLTPHEGEFKKLLTYFSFSAEFNDETRPKLLSSLAIETNAYIVLKGRYSIIANPQGELSINSSGSPALATAGSGDVLSGMIAALLHQFSNPLDAIKLAVFLHGYTGELAPVNRAFIADDIVEYLFICSNRW